jgi:putative ABC transport system permease protein
VFGTVAAAFYVIPVSVAVGLFLPSGPPWVYPAVTAATVSIVWPVTLLAARLAMRRRPVEAVNSPAAG